MKATEFDDKTVPNDLPKAVHVSGFPSDNVSFFLSTVEGRTDEFKWSSLWFDADSRWKKQGVQIFHMRKI